MTRLIGGGILFSRVPVVVLGAAMLCAGTARAEAEYEYARALIERDDPAFRTTDLVEHLIKQLEAIPGSRSDAKLIHAELDRHEARQASVARRATLLSDADKLYAELLAGPKTYAHYAVAEREAGLLNMETARALRKSAEEEPARRDEYLRNAAALFAKIAAGHKAESERQQPAFDAAYRAITKWIDTNDPDAEGKAVPAPLLTAYGKAFDAWIDPDQRYVAALVEQLDCMSDSDPARKTFSAEILTFCEKRSTDIRLANQEAATSWYTMMQGKVYAALLDEKEADAHWTEAAGAPVLKKAILRDRIRLKMKLQHYAEVVKLVEDQDGDLAQMISDDAGKEILETYTRAMTRVPDATPEDYERAIRALQALIEHESAPGITTAWSGQFSVAMSEIFTAARGKHMLPALRPAEWYSSATGFVLQADRAYLRYTELQRTDADHARPQFEKATAAYEDAAECLRRAITAAHAATPAVRLNIEPKAWMQLGRCYVRMQDFPEALVAYKAFQTLYQARNRTWLPDPAKAEARAFYSRQVNAALGEVDAMMQRLPASIAYVSERLRERHIPQPENDGPTTDSEFRPAQSKFSIALQLAETGRAQTAHDPALAADTFAEAAKDFEKAAELFKAVKSSSHDYEPALYKIAGALTHLQNLYAVERMRDVKPADAKLKSSEYAQQALDALQRYEDYIAKTAAATESAGTERANRAGALMLTRSQLCNATGAWEHALQHAEDYLSWAKANSAPPEGIDAALFNKFRALVELSAAQSAPDQDKFLSEASETMLAWRSRKPDGDATYRYMLARLIQRHETLAAGSSADAAIHYEKLADLEERRMSSFKAGEATLKDHAALLFAYKRANLTSNAVAAGKALLDNFDPKGVGTYIPDDPAPWQALLAQMIGDSKSGVKGVVRYDDLTKWDRCKADHTLLIDLMYDGAEAAQFPNGDAHRPAYDRFNTDMDKALAQAQTIRRNYPDCATLKPELGQNGKALLALVEDEIDFRRKIAAARGLVIDLSTQVCDELERDGKSDDAQTYRAIASDLLQKEIDAGRDTPELKQKLVGIYISRGKLNEALTLARSIRNDADSDSALYFDASKSISIIYARQNKWADAMEYPSFLEKIDGFDGKMVKERWPDMKAFLDECRAHT